MWTDFLDGEVVITEGNWTADEKKKHCCCGTIPGALTPDGDWIGVRGATSWGTGAMPQLTLELTCFQNLFPRLGFCYEWLHGDERAKAMLDVLPYVEIRWIVDARFWIRTWRYGLGQSPPARIILILIIVTMAACDALHMTFGLN